MLLSRPLPRRSFVRAGFYFALGVILLVVVAVAARRFFEATLAVSLPFVIGITLALLLDPLVDKLTRRGLSRGAAVGIVFGGLLLLLVGLGFLVIPKLAQQAGNLAVEGPKFVSGLQGRTNTFLATHHKLGPVTLPANFQALSDQFSGRVSGYLQQVTGQLTGILIGSVTFVIEMILALILTFFLLMDIDRMRARFLFLLPERWRKATSQMSGDVGGVFSDYLRGLLIVCALYGATTIGLLYFLSIFHHPLARYALLVGVAAGVLYAVPYLGSTATALLTFLVAFAAGTTAHHSGLSFAVTAVLLSLALNQVFDGVVTPKVVGGGVGLHPVLAVFALVMGGTLFSIWGMLLSVPIAGSIQIILFRLFPRLTQPTPPQFLTAQGVAPDKDESAKVSEGDNPSLPEGESELRKALDAHHEEAVAP